MLHVSNEKELKAAAGIAAPKTVAELREEEMSAEDLAALDEAENE